MCRVLRAGAGGSQVRAEAQSSVQTLSEALALNDASAAAVEAQHQRALDAEMRCAELQRRLTALESGACGGVVEVPLRAPPPPPHARKGIALGTARPPHSVTPTPPPPVHTSRSLGTRQRVAHPRRAATGQRHVSDGGGGHGAPEEGAATPAEGAVQCLGEGCGRVARDGYAVVGGIGGCCPPPSPPTTQPTRDAQDAVSMRHRRGRRAVWSLAPVLCCRRRWRR